MCDFVYMPILKKALRKWEYLDALPSTTPVTLMLPYAVVLILI